MKKLCIILLLASSIIRTADLTTAERESNEETYNKKTIVEFAQKHGSPLKQESLTEMFKNPEASKDIPSLFETIIIIEKSNQSLSDWIISQKATPKESYLEIPYTVALLHRFNIISQDQFCNFFTKQGYKVDGNQIEYSNDSQGKYRYNLRESFKRILSNINPNAQSTVMCYVISEASSK